MVGLSLGLLAVATGFVSIGIMFYLTERVFHHYKREVELLSVAVLSMMVSASAVVVGSFFVHGPVTEFVSSAPLFLATAVLIRVARRRA